MTKLTTILATAGLLSLAALATPLSATASEHGDSGAICDSHGHCYPRPPVKK